MGEKIRERSSKKHLLKIVKSALKQDVLNDADALEILKIVKEACDRSRAELCEEELALRVGGGVK